MNSFQKENRKRGILFAIAAIVFVLSASTALICGICMTSLTELHTSVQSAEDYGYDVYYIDNNQVTPYEFHSYISEYQYEVYPSYDEATFEENTLEENAFDENSLEENDLAENSLTSDNNITYGTATTIEVEEGFTIQHIQPDLKFNNDLYSEYMGRMWLVEIIAVILIPISLIIALYYCGQKTPVLNTLSNDVSKKNSTIKLNWFDYIFSEIQVAAAVAVSFGVILIYILLETWFASSEWIKQHIILLFNDYPDLCNLLSWMDPESWHGTYYMNFFKPTWILPVLSIIGTILIIAFDLLIITSIAKKIKAHRFWRGTILGAIFHRVTNAVEQNSAISGKVYLPVIGFAIAAAFLGFMGAIFLGSWAFLLFLICGIALIILTLMVLRKQVNKYKLVKSGLEEVQKGNFSYKIETLGDGEFGRLADLVNSITDAQNEAIRNELKSQRLRSELISNVSHDLRTPLTSMVSYVDLLKQEGLDSPNAKEYLDIISEKTDRLHKLTDDLFEAAKASSGDIPVNVEKINLDAMARQAIAELEENLATNNVELVYTCKSNNPEVMADGNLLWRVIENLITNVSKYALPGTRAYVDILDKEDLSDGESTSDKTTDMVKDNRIALTVKNMSRDALNISATELMERFQRGDDSRNTDGSGLGLAIANDLTMLMNGSFDIHIDGDLFKATVELVKA